MQNIWRRRGSAAHIIHPLWGKKGKKKVWTDNRRNQSTVMSRAAAWRVLCFFCFLLVRRGCLWMFPLAEAVQSESVRFQKKVIGGTASLFPQMNNCHVCQDTEQSTMTYCYYFIQVLTSCAPVKALRLWAVSLLLSPKTHLNIIAFSGES